MSRLTERLRAIARRGHIDEARLDELARVEAVETPIELDHLRACKRCRSLLVGFRRADAALTGAWVDRPIARGAEPAGIAPVRLDRPRRPGSVGTPRRAVVPALAAIVIALVATGGLLSLRGNGGLTPATTRQGSPGDSVAEPTADGTPQRTELVTRLPLGGQVSWAPDSQHLLVASQAKSVVYDRFGNVVSTFGQVEGWLDATHLISGDGRVAAIDEPYSGASQSNTWVVAGGHGAAAIVVAMPGCVGDPIIDWYRDGHYVKTGEKATPFGWSPDGKLVLLGHHDCADAGSPSDNWKGSVDVVDFASGKVLATAGNVRGDMAFNPSATRLAAQSDANLEIVDIAAGSVQTIQGAGFLGWFDDDHLYYRAGANLEMLNLRAGASVSAPISSGEWQVPSPAGPWLVLDTAGMARRIATADGTTTLLDLSSAELLIPEGETSATAASALQQRWWSPDGRLLVLAARNANFLALFSVTNLPGLVAGSLPTPIGSPQVVSELDRAALPGPVNLLVPDTARNAFWFLGGKAGEPIELYRYDVATAKLSSSAVGGTSYAEARDRLAVAPDGKLWIGAGQDLIVYEAGTGATTHVALTAASPDVQNDPKIGKPDPWVSGIVFDAKNGVALVARNWVRSLARIDASSLAVTGSVDVSDGFAMTGAIAFAGGRVFVIADPETGFGFGVDATGTQTLSNMKFTAPSIVDWGDRLLTAGTPPGLIASDGGGAALIEPVPATADLVASGPDGVAALYSAVAGEIQLRDAEGGVSGRGVFATGAAPRQITTLAFDAQGRLWAVESTGGSYSLVRLSLGS